MNEFTLTVINKIAPSDLSDHAYVYELTSKANKLNGKEIQITAKEMGSGIFKGNMMGY